MKNTKFVGISGIVDRSGVLLKGAKMTFDEVRGSKYNKPKLGNVNARERSVAAFLNTWPSFLTMGQPRVGWGRSYMAWSFL